jgi:peptide/nickel transport system permease protein
MVEREQVLVEPSVSLPGIGGVLGALNGVRRFARRRPMGAVCGIIILILLFFAAFAPVVARQDPLITNTAIKLQPPSRAHWFGTDDLGRDVYSRVVYGARVSLGIGFLGMLVAIAVGVAIAVVSGYFGGTTDIAIQRVVDAVQAIPGLIVVLTIVTILKPSIPVLFMALGLQAAFGSSRLIRSQVFSVKNMPFVDASRCIGASHVHIMWKAILPNVMSIAIITGSFALVGIILAEATLSFLGQGIQPPNPSWGQMLSGSARPFMVRAPWMGLAPGIALTVTLMTFSLFGDTLRDELDPRLRGSKGA